MNIEEMLQKGEKIVEIYYPSRWIYLKYYLIGIILLLLPFPIAFRAIGIIPILIAELLKRGNRYIITTERVIHEYTFLSRSIRTAPYSQIQDIHLTQSFAERLVGIGTININTAGGPEMEVIFKGVKKPLQVKKLIEEKRIKHQKRK